MQHEDSDFGTLQIGWMSSLWMELLFIGLFSKLIVFLKSLFSSYI